MDTLKSISKISHIFETGDRPFRICCEDMKDYLCKYNTTGGTSYSLCREYIGSKLAGIWGLNSVPLSLVELPVENIPEEEKIDILPGICLGRQWIDDTIDINKLSGDIPACTPDNLLTLAKIAIFDLWTANEDRINNNLNLLYSITNDVFIPIDFAGIFNTSFCAPLQQLDLSDSLMYSDLFSRMKEEHSGTLDMNSLKNFARTKISDCKQRNKSIYNEIPAQWGIKFEDYDHIMGFLFSEDWIDSTLSNFTAILEKI